VAPATGVVGVIWLVTAISTPSRSGPFCNDGCVTYPYTAASAYVPRDYLWMYPGILLMLLFVMLTACLAQWMGRQQKLR
jgi:hypothetical protein